MKRWFVGALNALSFVLSTGIVSLWLLSHAQDLTLTWQRGGLRYQQETQWGGDEYGLLEKPVRYVRIPYGP